MQYKQCGAYCRNTIPYASAADAAREPRIAVECGRYRFENEWCLLESSGEGQGSHFLGPDNRCTIYDTRPAACQEFQSGSPQCREVRGEITFEQYLQMVDPEEIR